ncbi:hypothetical protein NP233_g1461 [Leucocoprinus birnbaumii]|uniref:RxLR effector protein n=1 Tax=Leucocoprinus birnbaumii TaxID=56174 RepID=A0AAD5W0Y5_9AGAR|nr:hypothetical protein NP233_g1461 [Leucocoprinus birnbaumii]
MKFTIFSLLFVAATSHVVTALPIKSDSSLTTSALISTTTPVVTERATEVAAKQAGIFLRNVDNTESEARVAGIFLRNVHYDDVESSSSSSEQAASTSLAPHMLAIHM